MVATKPEPERRPGAPSQEKLAAWAAVRAYWKKTKGHVDEYLLDLEDDAKAIAD